MKLPLIAIATFYVVSTTACSPSGNPHLDMCQKITSNLLTSAATFGEPQETKGNRELTMVLPYSSDDASGESVCMFKRDRTPETYVTAPYEVMIDGLKVTGKALMQASLKSSSAVLKEGADKTAQQAAAVAEEAKGKASELASEAKTRAGEVATQITESEAVDRAKQLATETKDKAKSAIVEGAKAVQEKLEN